MVMKMRWCLSRDEGGDLYSGKPHFYYPPFLSVVVAMSTVVRGYLR